MDESHICHTEVGKAETEKCSLYDSVYTELKTGKLIHAAKSHTSGYSLGL